MKCWYFVFEGLLHSQETAETTPLYSTALVPCSIRSDAIEALKSDLSAYRVDLIDIEDDFLFDPSEIDHDNQDNVTWLSMYDEVNRLRETMFSPWITFPHDDESTETNS